MRCFLSRVDTGVQTLFDQRKKCLDFGGGAGQKVCKTWDLRACGSRFSVDNRCFDGGKTSGFKHSLSNGECVWILAAV